MKNFKYGLFIRVFRPFLNIHRPGKEKNIFIFSLPRSGSTWLMELIWSQPGFKCCNEPLDLSIPNLCTLSNIDGFAELYSDEVKPKLLKYFSSIASGKAHFMDPQPLRKYYRFFTSRIVFKVIHGGEKFINEICENSNGIVIYLLRHPIPVALSRKKLPRLKELCSPFALSEFSESQRQMAQCILNTGNELEKRMLAWCIQNKLALMQRNKNWLVITYEQLSVDPNPVIKEIVTFCNLTAPARIFSGLNKPSAVTTQSEADSKSLLNNEKIEKEALIGRWMGKINPIEAKKLMLICKTFDMDVYSYNSAMPNKSWLIKFGKV